MLPRLTLSGLASLVAVTIACAPAPAPPAPPAPAPPAAPAPAAPAAPAPAAAPKKGGTLVYTAGRPPEALMPYKSASIGDYVSWNGVYEGLIYWKFSPDIEAPDDYRSTYTVAPNLAEKWEVSSDGRTYIFTLRKDAKWHDGQPVTVDDVLFSYGLLMDPANGYIGGANLREVETIEKVAADQLKIVIKAASAQFLMGLAPSNTAMFILPRHKADRLTQEVVGSGPFKVKSADLRSKIVLVRNDDWRDKQRPYMDGGEVIFGLDNSARLAAISARKVDFHSVGDKRELEPILKANSDLKVFSFFQSDGTNLLFNLNKKPYDDQPVRKAIDLALDRQTLAKALYGGEAAINPPAGIGHKKNWGIPQEELQKLPGYRQPKDADIAEAKRLLAEAGYPSGFKTSGVMRSGISGGIQTLFEGVAGQLKSIGVDMTVEFQESGIYIKRQREGDYDILFAFAAGDVPNERLIAFFHSKGALNSYIRDSKLDELIERQSQTADLAARGRLHAEIQRLVYDKTYTLGTIDPAAFHMVQPWVHNITLNRGAQPYPMDWSVVWLDADKIPPR